MKKKTSPLFIVLFIILVFYCLLMVFMFGWAIITSLRLEDSFDINPLSLSGFPTTKYYLNAFVNFKIEVYKSGTGEGYKVLYLEQMFFNSLEYALGCAFVNTFFTCVVAYVSARFKYFFCKWLYVIVIVVMALPIVGNLPSELAMSISLGIYDTMIGMFIMRSTFLGFYFLVFVAIFKSVPQDYQEAAYIDGANDFSIFFKIMMPLARDTFLTILLLYFISYWNDYSVPLVYLPSRPPLAVGLYTFKQSTDNVISSVPAKMAGCIIAVIPITLIFIVFQKRLMGNLTVGGIKE